MFCSNVTTVAFKMRKYQIWVKPPNILDSGHGRLSMYLVLTVSVALTMSRDALSACSWHHPYCREFEGILLRNLWALCKGMTLSSLGGILTSLKKTQTDMHTLNTHTHMYTLHTHMYTLHTHMHTEHTHMQHRHCSTPSIPPTHKSLPATLERRPN